MAAVVLVATVMATVMVPSSVALSQRTSSRTSSRPTAALDSAVTALDMWITQRFQGAGLLPDSGKAARTTRASPTPPRIESVSTARTRDTLFAVQFAPQLAVPALAVGSIVRLSSPSGVMTTTTAEIITRRAFRAPRQPGAASNDPTEFRYGWSYMALIRSVTSTPSTMYRGWVLVDVPPAKLNSRSP